MIDLKAIDLARRWADQSDNLAEIRYQQDESLTGNALSPRRVLMLFSSLLAFNRSLANSRCPWRKKLGPDDDQRTTIRPMRSNQDCLPTYVFVDTASPKHPLPRHAMNRNGRRRRMGADAADDDDELKSHTSLADLNIGCWQSDFYGQRRAGYPGKERGKW